jgi:DNA end-binding protein Ku
VEAAVQKKVEGQEITMLDAPETGAQVIDLMEALRASLERKAAPPSKAKAQSGDGRKPPKRAQAAEPVAATPRKARNKA